MSSIGQSSETLRDHTHKPTVSPRPAEGPTETPHSDDDTDTDLRASDSELDAQLELRPPGGDGRIPDCIVESVVDDEMTVAFSESIRQRVRRERLSRRSRLDRGDTADLSRDPNQSDGETVERGKRKEEEASVGGGVREEGRMLDFVGDWPSAGPLDQRQLTPRCSEGEGDGGVAAETNTTKVESGPELLDLIQTGGSAVPCASSCSEDPHGSGSDGEGRQQNLRSSSGLECPKGSADPEGREGHDIPDQNRDVADVVSQVFTSTAPAATEAGRSSDVERELGSSPANPCPEQTDCHPGGPQESSQIREGGQSPVCDVEAGSSQERKLWHGRKSGKLCKLALTFTQTPPGPFSSAAGGPPQLSVSTENECGVWPEWRSEALPLHPPPSPLGERSHPTQTEPQDFAFLWRLNRQDHPEDPGVAGSGHSSDMCTVLCGDSSGFVPGSSSGCSAAVDSSRHSEVPYRVVHEKGTQVEDQELGTSGDRLESLRVLSRHFKLVSFDTLQDLYDKCHHDLEWTTNLLLDSGESFFRDEDGVEDTSDLRGTASETNLFDDTPPTGGGGGLQQTSNAATDSTSLSDDPPESHSADPSETQHRLRSSETGERRGHAQLNAASDGVLARETWGGGGGDGGTAEEQGAEMASMEEAHRILQAELQELERQGAPEGRREAQQRERPRPLDIHSVELKLPTELALQLTELFGPVGVDPGRCHSTSPKLSEANKTCRSRSR